MPAERLDHSDSQLLHFTARVADVREYARRDGKQVWQIALDRTAFYPTGGGQPHDTGTLTARARSGASLCLPVEDVSEDESGEVWHTTAKPLLAGTEIEAEIDAMRRLDHMQQHSGQHLLSAILADRFSAPTIAFHLGAESTTIDLGVESPEAQAELELQLPEVERLANEAIARNLPVTVEQVSRAEAEQLLAARQLRKLPPVEGTVRLVRMGELDLNACGGTHVSALGQVGALLLRDTERVKRALRLYFVCGLRAVRASRVDREQLSGAAAQFSVAREGVVAAAARQAASLRALERERQHLREELAQRHAADLAATPRQWVEEHMTGRDPVYLRMLASALLRRPGGGVVVLSAAQAETASVLLASREALPGGCGALLREALAAHGLRGGGSAELAQSNVPAPLLEPVLQTLRTTVLRAQAAHD